MAEAVWLLTSDVEDALGISISRAYRACGKGQAARAMPREEHDGPLYAASILAVIQSFLAGAANVWAEYDLKGNSGAYNSGKGLSGGKNGG